MACLYDRYEISEIAKTIIEQKGYKIEYYDQLEVFLATNREWSFRAETLTSLLGIINVHESHLEITSDNRLNIVNFEDILLSIKRYPSPYEPVYKRPKND